MANDEKQVKEKTGVTLGNSLYAESRLTTAAWIVGPLLVGVLLAVMFLA